MTAQPHTTRPLIVDQSGVGGIRRWRAHRGAQHLSTGNRAKLARWLRRTANRTPSRDPHWARRDVLLYERIMQARAALLDIADTLECTDEPEPGCIATLHELLTDGCKSPLYNPDIHISELRATLYYVRSSLAETATEQR